jgi:undecaprenyl-diphosphatase
MLDGLIEFDKNLMLAINGATSSWADFIMPIITYKYTGIPIYCIILILLFYKRNLKTAILMTIAVIMTFALCDSLSVALFKHTVHRLRPCWDPTISEYVRMLEYKGGQYGFVSSHAANLFGLATITSFLIRKRVYIILIFIWAALVGYSRIYVGKHFPLDVICGAMFGMLIGYLVWLLYKYAMCRLSPNNK